MVITAAVSRSESRTSDAVKAVSVVSTGHVEIRPEHVFGSKEPFYWWLLTSRKWTEPRPINAYVIEHAAGLILFDTGQDRASVTDHRYFPGGLTGLVYDRLARFQIGRDETLKAQLSTLGYSPADVRTAIVSHLHQDHIGGLPELGKADILVTADEWTELSKPAPAMRGFLRNHIEIPGLKWQRIEFEPNQDPALAAFSRSQDFFGDGSLVLLPTPGHTAGSVSLLIRRREKAPLLLVGDLTYSVDLLEHRQVPGVGQHKQMLETTDKVLALKRAMPDLVILAAHDPSAAQRLLAS